MAVLEQALLEAASDLTSPTPLEYLLACWKRVTRAYRGLRTGRSDDQKHTVLREARRLCMSYCLFAATIPEMFGSESSAEGELKKHLLVDPDNDYGICHDFLSEAISRFGEDDSIKHAFVSAVEAITVDLSKLSMNDDYKPHVLVSGGEIYCFGNGSTESALGAQKLGQVPANG